MKKLTSNGKTLMAARFMALLTVVFCSITSAQQDVGVRLGETQLNEALATLIDARGVNFGDYLGRFITDAWFVNLDGGTFDVHSNNAITIHANIVATAVAVLNLVNNVTVHPSFDINGTLRIDAIDGGYKLMYHPQNVSNFSATGTFLDDLIQGAANGFISQMPEIELNSGTKLLPDAITSYFTSPIPTLATTENEIIFYFSMAGPRRIVAFNEVNQREDVGEIQEVVGEILYPYTSPATFWWDASETHRIQTPVPLLDETNGKNKYRNWFKEGFPYALGEVAPRRIEFLVDNDAGYKAKFDPAKRVQLSNYLIETGSAGGTVTYENTTAPAIDDYDFQDAFIQHPITTDVADGTQGLDWIFQCWSDGSTHQSRNIVLNDDINLVANYKAHLASTAGDATGLNSQQKIATYNGTSHAVYESGGYIWYTRNTGNGWQNEKLLAGAKNPAIAVTERITQVYVHVVFEYPHEYAGHVYHDVHYLRSSDNGNTWEDILLAGDVEGWASIDVDAVPVIAGEGNVLVVWKYGSDADGGLAMQIDPGLEGSIAQPVAHTNNTSRNPAVNVELIGGVPRYRITYETDGGKIYFTEFLEGADDPMETRQLTGGYDWMSNSSNPSITGSDPLVFVSWEADDARGGTTVRRVFCRDRQSDGSWPPVVSLREGTRPVVQVRPDKAALDLLWQQSGNVMRISRQVQRPIWTSAADLGQGNSPTIGTATQVGVPSFAAWTTGTAAPYVVNIEELSAPEFEHWTANWNITGISVRVPDYSPLAVFPDASLVYKFECEGYVPVTVRCDSNRGFWTKFPLNQPTWPITYTGTFIDSMAMPVRNCWNMIGSISIPVDTGAVWYDPPAIRASVFFKYLQGSGYLIVERLNPGLGYWVKSSQRGYMILQNIPHQSGGQEERIPRDKFIVTSGDGSRQELYVVNAQVSPGAENIEMPPPPPEFDARWQTGDIQVAVEPTGDPIELPISVNQAVMPITLEWELDPETGLEYDLPSGGGLHKGISQTISEKGRAVFSSQMSYIVLVANGKNVKHESEVPTVFELHQNYPNPFNPSTQIKVDLPEASTVSLIVYDVLGRQIAELASGHYEAGYHFVTWNASNQASGIYFARFNVTDALGNVKYTKVNKLVLMK